jgi:PAS domain S-box-containing protein
MQSNLYPFQSRQIGLMARVTPYAMAGHIANTTVIAIALAGSVRPAPLIIWCAYSYVTALFLLYRNVRNRRRWPRSFQRAAKKATIYAFLLALPWSSLGVLYLGSLSHGEELLLASLGIGMAACGTVLLSAVPSAAFSYISVILLPSAFKYLLVGQEAYFLLGTLALSYWGCLAALIAKTGHDIRERQESERALAERNAQMAMAGTAALVGSFGYDVNNGKMQVSEGYAAIHGLRQGTTETSLSEWRASVHPDDVERVEELRDLAFADQRKEYNVEYRIVRPSGEVRWIEKRSSISYGEDGPPQRVVGVNIDVTERKRAEQQQHALNAELDHRVKNVLASVATVAQRTREGSGSMDEFLQVFDGRIQSMANAHALLSRSHWEGVSLTDLVHSELAPCVRVGNARVEGPEVVLSPEATQPIAIVLHELVTNASKYGALTMPQGRILVRWDWRRDAHTQGRLLLEWVETGGPPVVIPSQPGYGTSAIRNLVPYELDGTVDLNFDAEGLRCSIELPSKCIRSDTYATNRIMVSETSSSPANC